MSLLFPLIQILFAPELEAFPWNQTRTQEQQCRPLVLSPLAPICLWHFSGTQSFIDSMCWQRPDFIRLGLLLTCTFFLRQQEAQAEFHIPATCLWANESRLATQADQTAALPRMYSYKHTLIRPSQTERDVKTAINKRKLKTGAETTYCFFFKPWDMISTSCHAKINQAAYQIVNRKLIGICQYLSGLEC